MTNSKGPNSKLQTDKRGLLCLVVALSVAALGGCRGQELPSTVVRKTTITVEELRPRPGELGWPKRTGSVKFAVIGDSGRGDQAQTEVAQQLVAWREKLDYDLVVMVGDNIYDRHTPEDYAAKFERPYKPLLDAGVKFQAAIGNHDDAAQINYEKFNMGGRRYYSFRRSDRPLGPITGGGVRFFALDSRSFVPEQLTWLQKELADSTSKWKIVYFHHPIYTSGRYQTGARTLRSVLEPFLVAGDVDVVISGHEHFYERILPQRGIAYFVTGAAGSLRPNDIRRTNLTARGFDTDYSFMLMEVSEGELFFQAISRKGETVDAGVIRKK